MKKGFNSKSKTCTLQTKMFITMGLVIVIQAIILFVILEWTNFFYKVDQESIDTFNMKAVQKVDDVNFEIESIIKDVARASQSATYLFKTEASKNNENISNTWLGDSKYNNARIDSTQILLELIDNNSVDGAFLILSNNSEYAGIKIKDTKPSELNENRETYELVVGIDAIAEKYGIDKSTAWDEKWYFENQDDIFYNNVLNAVLEYPNSSIDRYGYWNIPSENSSNNNVCYSVPMIDEAGNAYGIIGIEISNSYFKTEYLQQNSNAYEKSFNVLGKLNNDNIIEMDNTLNISNFEQVKLSSSKFQDFELYKSTVDSLGMHLVAKTKLSMYASDSPFVNEQLEYFTFVKQSVTYEKGNELKIILIISYLATMIVGSIVIFINIRKSGRKIIGLSKYVEKLLPHQEILFKRTNLKEIDTLIVSIEKLNQKVIDSSAKFARIIELTDLDIGGYEVMPDESGVIATEYIHRLLGIKENSKISNRDWQYAFKKLTANLEKENTYRYKFEDEDLWLKIITSKTDKGSIGVIVDTTKEIKDAIEAQHKLDHDALTGLYNRTAFQREAKKIAQKEPNLQGAMMFIDLDNLKFTNDTYGHEAGDAYIKAGSRIFDSFKEFGGIAARISGDEFAVYIHGYTSIDQISKIIYTNLERHKEDYIDLPDGTKQKIRFSTGVAWYQKDSHDIPQLVKFADFAMYEAKHTLKGSVREFNMESYQENVFIMENNESINELIDKSLVKFMFQPIADLKTGEIFAYEALMRSQLDAFKTPIEILKVASAQFKLGKLENMIVRKAIADAYEMRSIIGDKKIFVNSITGQSMGDEIYDELTQEYGSFIKNVVIEVTEAEDNTPEKMQAKTSLIRKYGMQIAIDDFGTGYSNELRILSIKPDIVKIDMELINGIATNDDKQLLVTNIVGYCHAKGIKVVASGLENECDLKQVIKIGVDYVQGYYLAKPSFEIIDIDKKQKNEIIEFSKIVEINQ